MEQENNYYPITGKLFEKGETVQVSDKFKKRSFVLEVANEWNGTVYTPHLITFEFVQDSVDKLDYVNVGDPVEVMFTLNGRQYQKKDGSGTAYFNTNKATRITSKKVVTATPQQNAPQDNQETAEHVFGANQGQEYTDLPF